jgi:archaellum biogenesis protein FlaJ (TadC family)
LADLLGPFVNLGPIRRLEGWRANKIQSLLRKSGRIGNPQVIAHGSIILTFGSAALLLPAAAIASLVGGRLFLLLALGPLVPFVLPELRLMDAAAHRREGVEKELPFFSMLVNVLGGAGVPLYSIFEGLTATEILESIKREALQMRRDVAIFGMNPIDAFERIAAGHPSEKFARFLNGYASKVRTGGDLPAYLAGESDSLLRELEANWVRYTGRVGVIGSLMITVFGVVTLMLMVVGIFSPGTSVVGLSVFCGLALPVFTILVLYLAGRMQPLGEEALRGNAPRSVLIATIGLAGAPLTGQVWVGAAMALTMFFVAYGLSVREQLKATKETETGLNEFMKDLIEFKRQEYDLTKALVAIASQNKYTRAFGRLLAEVSAQLRAGVPMEKVMLESPNRLAKLSFFLLGQMSRSGGGTVDTVYQMSTYASRLVEMKRNARAEMRPYIALSYASPVLLAFGVAFVSGVLHSFRNTVGPSFAGTALFSANAGAQSAALSEISSLMIVVSSAALGLIGAKIADFTVRNTLRASTNVGMAAIAMAAMSLLNFHSWA